MNQSDSTNVIGCTDFTKKISLPPSAPAPCRLTERRVQGTQRHLYSLAVLKGERKSATHTYSLLNFTKSNQTFIHKLIIDRFCVCAQRLRLLLVLNFKRAVFLSPSCGILQISASHPHTGGNMDMGYDALFAKKLVSTQHLFIILFLSLITLSLCGRSKNKFADVCALVKCVEIIIQIAANLFMSCA